MDRNALAAARNDLLRPIRGRTTMFADHLRAAIEAAPRIKVLDAVASQLWGVVAEGHVTEDEATALSALIDIRRQVLEPGRAKTTVAVGSDAPKDRIRSPRTGRNGSRPRTDASLGRRRTWSSDGRLMPPKMVALFTQGERSVLAVIADETQKRKDCRLAIDHIGALAGVGRSTVKNAIREAARLGLLTVEERRLSGWRSDTNVVTIVSVEWLSWLRLARKRRDRREAVAFAAPEVGGVKLPTCTPKKIIDLGKPRAAEPSQGLPRGSGRPDQKRFDRNRTGR